MTCPAPGIAAASLAPPSRGEREGGPGRAAGEGEAGKTSSRAQSVSSISARSAGRRSVGDFDFAFAFAFEFELEPEPGVDRGELVPERDPDPRQASAKPTDSEKNARTTGASTRVYTPPITSSIASSAAFCIWTCAARPRPGLDGLFAFAFPFVFAVACDPAAE